MATIKITQETRDLLQEYAGEVSLNDALVRLLNASDKPVQVSDSTLTSANVRIDEATLDELKLYKLTPYERHSDTILRLLLEQG